MGTVATGAHPSGFNGQDAFNDRLVIDNPEVQPTPVTYTVRRLTPTECARLQASRTGGAETLEQKIRLRKNSLSGRCV